MNVSVVDVTKRKIGIIPAIILIWIALFLLDQLALYMRLPPMLRLVQLETLKHPLSSTLDSSGALQKHFGINATKQDVLSVLEEANLRVAEDLKNSSSSQREIYHSISLMPSGVFGSIFLMSLEVAIDATFDDDILTEIKSRTTVAAP